MTSPASIPEPVLDQPEFQIATLANGSEGEPYGLHKVQLGPAHQKTPPAHSLPAVSKKSERTSVLESVVQFLPMIPELRLVQVEELLLHLAI